MAMTPPSLPTEEQLLLPREVPVSRMSRVLNRVRRAWNALVGTANTTASGLGVDTWNRLSAPFQRLSTKRFDVYRDVEEMDNTVEEINAALSILADNAVYAEEGRVASFTIKYVETPSRKVTRRVKKLIDACIERTLWQEKVFGYTREVLKYGDLFLQYVLDEDYHVARLMFMPQKTMYRNEDYQGRLLNGNQPGEWAFEQYAPDSNQLIAGFYPWQIEHIRWNRSGGSAYGRSHLFASRTAWKKLQAMEEALVLNWITRAFARLMFIIDTSNMSSKQAQTAIEKFKSSLQTKKLSTTTKGEDPTTVVKDIFIGRGYHDYGSKIVPGLTDAKVLDTSTTGFWNISPLEYNQAKMVTGTRVPRAHLGLEKHINAKATLQLQDRRFGRTVRRIQTVMSQPITHTIAFELMLAGVDPREIPFYVAWPQASWYDDVDESVVLRNLSTADKTYKEMGVIDNEYIAKNHLRMDDAEWEALSERLTQEQAGQEPAQGAGRNE